MPNTETPPPSGDGAAMPDEWRLHDIDPAQEGWFIVAHWPGLDLADTVLDVGYVRHTPGYAYMEGRIDSHRGLDGSLYVRLPDPVILPF